MEQKIVTLQIKDEFISGANVTIGAAGSHDDVLMEMDFRSSPLWKGLAKRAIFSNALGEPCPPIILTTNLLEEGQSDVYLVPVAAEAKNVAGEVFLTVEGFIGEGETEKIRVVTEEATFRVLPSKLYHNENPSLTPTEAEQLQAEVDQIKQDIVDAAKAATALEETKEAQAKAEAARDLSLQYANDSEQFAEDAAERVNDAAAEVQKAAAEVVKAKAEVNNAKAEADRAKTEVNNAKAEVTKAKTEVQKAAAEVTKAKKEVNNAKAEADRAQAEAESVRVPAAVGVYNVILADRTTGERYALLVEDGKLEILGVSNTLEATELNLIDSVTGVAYALLVESGKITLQEV